MELATIAPAEYAREVLPHSAALWARGRSREEYVADFHAMAQSAYGRRRFRTVGLRIDGRLVASLKRYERDLRCGDRTFRAVGIGAVFTPWELRGRGYASAMLGALLDREREAGADVGFLFSDIHPTFYERLGFVQLPSRLITLRSDALPAQRQPVVALEDSDWSSIARCFEGHEGRRAFALRRTPLVWDYLRSRQAAAVRQGGFLRLGVRRGRTLCAYVMGRRSAQNDAFILDELAFSGDDGEDAIPALVRSAAGDLRRVTGWLPPSPVRNILPAGAVRRRTDAIAMVAPLSRAARSALRGQLNHIGSDRGDQYWSSDHV